MENRDFQLRDLDDLIFEYRNRAYGAYVLRKIYQNHLKKAAIWGFFSTILLITSPLIGEKMRGDGTLEDNRIIEMSDLPKEKKPDVPKPKIEQPKPIEQPKKIATIRVTPPKVKDDEQVKEPDFIPKVDDITVAVSTKTQDGVLEDLPPDAAVPPPIGSDEGDVKQEETKKKEDDTPLSIVAVEQKPEFPDGERAMLLFLKNNVVYPSIARENGISGTVYVRFVVWKDGSIRNVEAIRKVAGGCSEEAERVVKKCPIGCRADKMASPFRLLILYPLSFSWNKKAIGKSPVFEKIFRSNF
ncbi:MAG: hypothetical protein HC817_00370 [Saprospiraceae bacterium]|nr:hypothetical protein [Saprospiraceae bacterium]